MEELLKITEQLFEAQSKIEKMCKAHKREEFWYGAKWAITFIKMRLDDLKNEENK